MRRSYQGKCPEIHETAFIEESAQIIGDVCIGRDSSVWFQAVLRGDVHSIRIGERKRFDMSNIKTFTDTPRRAERR